MFYLSVMHVVFLHALAVSLGYHFAHIHNKATISFLVLNRITQQRFLLVRICQAIP